MRDLAAKFTEVEQRVRALVAENRRLSGRLAELEQQLADARRDARDLERMQGKREEVRDRLERVLRSLEALGTDAGGDGADSA